MENVSKKQIRVSTADVIYYPPERKVSCCNIIIFITCFFACLFVFLETRVLYAQIQLNPLEIVKTGDQRPVNPLEIVRPGDRRPELPEYEGKTPPPEIGTPPTLPPVPKTEDDITTAQKVYIKEYKFIGNTVFSDSVLKKIAKPYARKAVTFEMLEELRHKLTLYYINQGYRNSGAIIPDQKVTAGVVVFAIIEGTLDRIEIKESGKIRARFIKSRLELGSGPPLDINDLQKQVQLLHQKSIIRKIDAELSPGLGLGKSILTVHAYDASPWIFGVRFDNHRSPSVGSLSGEIYGSHMNLTGWGDNLSVSYGLTKGLDDWSVSYALPVSRYDTTLTLRYERSDSEVIEEPYDQIDIESKSETWGITLAHPLYKSPAKEFSFSLTGERRHSETFLGGDPFSFSPGAEDGQSDVTVIRFAQNWLSRDRKQVFAVRSVFNVGIGALGATHNDTDPDGRFFSWLGQFQWARRLNFLNSQLITRTDCQFANDSLMSLEKFSIGGANSIRGYRENQLVRDNGLAASIELRVPLFRMPVWKVSRTQEDGILYLAPFFDWGWAENTDSVNTDPRTISSVGAGLRWDPSAKIHAEVYWGHALRDIENPNEYDLQDSGVHFLFNCRFF